MFDLRDEVIGALENTLHTITGAGGNGYDCMAAQREVREIEALAGDILALTKDNASAGDFFEGKLAELYDKRARLLREIDEAEQSAARSDARAARLEHLMDSIRSAPTMLDKYDDAFTREIVESVKVVDSSRVIVTLKGGVEVDGVIVGQ